MRRAAALVAAASATLAMAVAPVAAGVPHHAPWTAAQEQLAMELLHAGAAVKPPLVELHASPEPAELELVASGVGEGVEVSVRVVRHSNWGGDSGEPPVGPSLADHGAGEATLVVDRSSPGELVIEAAASGPGGEARAIYAVRVLDALPPPGSQDRAAPSRIVGRVDPADPALPRILAQAGRPLCADVGGTAMIPEEVRSGWRGSPVLSGVPPIEGMALQEAEIRDPAARTASDHPSWWGCYTAALFGTQVPQWIYVCDVPGSDRQHYYGKSGGSSTVSAATYALNPYNGELTRFSKRIPLPLAAAPGPHWARISSDYDSGYPPPGFDPHAPVPPNEVSLTELRFGASGPAQSLSTRVKGSLSSVPEFLPLDGKVVLRATAFHSDNVVFRTSQPMGAPLAIPDRYATVNGTAVRSEPYPEPHFHSGYAKQQFRNGTEIRHHIKAHALEEVKADREDPRTPSAPHYHLPPHVAASVRVSDIALRNGILIEGITDGAAGMPRESQQEFLRARGIQDDLDVGGMEVKRLHEVMLVAELPVHVSDVGDYARIDPELSVAPWECWPQFYHPLVCLEEEWEECPSGSSGAAWVP
ncbi:MAG: hypothetical protein OXU53_00665 [Deltaproteobacteria bacterium]|nr:hypothetical protein [Deltaproteobacteria bacterium]